MRRYLPVGLVVALAAGAALFAAGPGRSGEVQPPADGSALDQPLDLKGCSSCTLRHQSIIRHLKEKRAETPANGDCRVKGDITAAGERVYHLPGEDAYDLVWISAERGERWFCSAAEAEAEGWRAAGE
jgi:hypothetical protein